jgi:hypothetical protein
MAEALSVLLHSPSLAFTMAVVFLGGFLLLRRLPQIRERWMLAPVVAWLAHGACLYLLASSGYPGAAGVSVVLPALGLLSFVAPFLALSEAPPADMRRPVSETVRKEMSTHLPEDVAAAERSLLGWLNAFKGKSPSQIEALLGAAERSSWDFAGRPSPLFRYRTASGATLDLYFASDAVVSASYLLIPQ